LKGRERMGSAFFKKMKCIFSIVPVGKLEKSRTPDARLEAPDDVFVRPVWRQCLA